MLTYQKFLVNDTEQFEAANYPALEPSLRKMVTQLSSEPYGPKAEMILSFVKDHCMRSEQVAEHPALANLISSKTLSLQVVEDLFEASKKNPAFRKDLENYIAGYFRKANVY